VVVPPAGVGASGAEGSELRAARGDSLLIVHALRASERADNTARETAKRLLGLSKARASLALNREH